MSSWKKYNLKPCPVCGYEEVHYLPNFNQDDIHCTLCGFTMTATQRRSRQLLIDAWNSCSRDEMKKTETITELTDKCKDLQDKVRELQDKIRELQISPPDKEKKCYSIGVYREFCAKGVVRAVDEEAALHEGMLQAHDVSLDDYEVTEKEPEVVVYGVMGE